MAGIAHPQAVPDNNAEGRLPVRAPTDATALGTPVLGPIVWMGDSKRNLRGFPEGAQKLLGMSFNSCSLAVCRGMPNLSKVSAAAFLRLPGDTRRRPIAWCWRCRSAGGFMFCTPFRRNRRKALKLRSVTLT